jgi:hypothetical protein
MAKMLDKEQSAIIGAYTGVCCGNFSDIHELAEKVLGRPVLTHEFATAELTEELKKKTKQMFIDICYKE